MPAGNVVEEEVGKTLLGVSGSSVAKPTKLFLALCEAEQNRTLTSETLTNELTYEGYKRTELELAEYEWTIGTSGEAGFWVNKAAIKLPVNTNTTGKYIAKYWAILPVLKANESGKLYFYGTFEAEREIVKTLSEAAKIEPKALKIKFE